MSLTLPADAEPFVDDDISELRQPGCYALKCRKPDNPREEWHQHFEETPNYLDLIDKKQRIAYVGASNDVLSRLEDHRDADKRKAALLRVCEPIGVLNIKFFQTAQQAFDREYGLARRFQRQHPEFYVHQR
jgi:predicted GIY-YIG superfamily endonuclease